MSTTRNVARHLAMAERAARELADAGSEAEAALLLEAGFAALEAAVAAAPAHVAERVQNIVNEIAGKLLGSIRADALEDAVAAATA